MQKHTTWIALRGIMQTARVHNTIVSGVWYRVAVRVHQRVADCSIHGHVEDALIARRRLHAKNEY